MNPLALAELRAWHDKGHPYPENSIQQPTDFSLSLAIAHSLDVENLKGHRMEAYITWEKYARHCKLHPSKGYLHIADYLHRRYNDLTDQLIELTGNDSYKHYDIDFATGAILEHEEQS